MDDRFLVCLPYALIEECPDPANWSDPKNFSDDPHDPGGATQCGIIQTEFTAFLRSNGLPNESVRQMTREQGETIYRQQYWMPNCPLMPTGVDLCLFDMNVNGGPVQSAKLLQRALGVSDDGHIGLITLGAVKDTNPIKLVSAFSEQRKSFYHSLRTFRYFGKGWLNRVASIEAAALKMAAGA